MVLFKDLNKESNDLLTRDFVHDRPWDVEFKHSGKNPVFTQNAFVNSSGVVDASSSAKYSAPSGSMEVKFGVSSAMIEATYKAFNVSGLTIASKFDRSFQSKGAAAATDSVELSTEYLATNGTHWRFSVKPLLSSWALSGLACIALKQWAGTARLGAELSGGSDPRNWKYSLGGSYSQSTKDIRYTASFHTLQFNGSRCGKIVANVHAKSANNQTASEYGVEVSHSIADAKTQMGFVGLWRLKTSNSSSLVMVNGQPSYSQSQQQLGGGDQQQMSAKSGSNTGSSSNSTFVKAKLTTDAMLSASLTHVFNDSLSAIFGAQIDARKPSYPDSIKYGMKIKVLA